MRSPPLRVFLLMCIDRSTAQDTMMHVCILMDHVMDDQGVLLFHTKAEVALAEVCTRCCPGTGPRRTRPSDTMGVAESQDVHQFYSPEEVTANEYFEYLKIPILTYQP